MPCNKNEFEFGGKENLSFSEDGKKENKEREMERHKLRKKQQKKKRQHNTILAITVFESPGNERSDIIRNLESSEKNSCERRKYLQEREKTLRDREKLRKGKEKREPEGECRRLIDMFGNSILLLRSFS